METEAFEAVVAPRMILSDRVIREEGTGKLSLIGCFDTFIGQSFPFQSVSFFVTVTITNVRSFPKELNIVVRIETSAGHVMASSQAQVTKKPDAPQIPRHGAIDVVFPFPPVRFDSAGVFNLVCLVSNEPLATRQFEVKSITTTAQQS